MHGGGSSKNLLVERYTPSKYNNQLFYTSFEGGQGGEGGGGSIMIPRSNSSSSSIGPKVDYKVRKARCHIPIHEILFMSWWM